MSQPERPDPLPSLIRVAVLIALTALTIWFGIKSPIVLIGIAVLIAFILAIAKVLGDIMWNEDARPEGTKPRSATKNTTPVSTPLSPPAPRPATSARQTEEHAPILSQIAEKQT